MVVTMRACIVGMVFLVSGLSASQTGTNVEISDIHGTQLLHLCSSPADTMESQFCNAFIVGVRDGVVLAIALREARTHLINRIRAPLVSSLPDSFRYFVIHPERHCLSAASVNTRRLPITNRI
jgi:hypothetical protein